MKKKNQTQEAQVLYQRLNGKWYAFSQVGDEVFFSPIPDNAFDEHLTAAEARQEEATPIYSPELQDIKLHEL